MAASAATTGAARLVAGGAALLAGAVLADSSIEHYRGSFDNRAMPVPLAGSALALGTDLALAATGRVGSAVAPLAMSVHAASAAIGTAGLGFHAWNIGKQAGGVRWGTLFYQAPLGAPAALVLAGGLGAAAQALARGQPTLGPVPLLSGRVLAGVCALGIAGTAAEAALLHFRGAYHNKAMWLPVTLTPLAALALARTALIGRLSWITTAALAVTAALGFAGSGFHAYGISRGMGGWRNWRQNLLDGPPLPAPPSYTGLAIAAFGALLLMRRARRG
jgi:hypothetical protein